MAKAPKEPKDRDFLDQIGRAQVLYSILVFAGTSGLATVAAVSGFLERQPVMWIITCAVLVLYAGLGAAYFFGHVLEFITPMNKLRYVNTMVARDLVEIKPARTQAIADTLLKTRHLERMQLGVFVQNTSHFDLSAYIERADTQIEGNRPPIGQYPKAATKIRPGQTVVLFDDLINMNSHRCGRLNGRLDMLVKYGEAKNEKYDIVLKANVDIMMRPDGNVENVWTMWDASK